jgi:hypothetical protein
MKARFVWILTLMLVALASPVYAVTIEGIVRDRDGNGLAGTIIEVYAIVGGQLEVVGKTTSREEDTRTGKPRGYYHISVTSEQLISAVSYDNDAWQPRVVKDLSGRAGDNHVINKVLLQKQGPVGFLPILEQVHEYEELYYLERERVGSGTSGDAVQRAVRVKYEERIWSMPDPRRANLQPAKQQKIVEQMTDEQRRVLARKMDELFSLYGISMDGDLRQSRWDTTYVGPGGQRIRAVVTIDGQSGKYQIVRGNQVIDTGQLYDIDIKHDGEAFSVSGKWHLGEARGYFRWRSKPKAAASFEGEWGYHPDRGPEGSWNGKRILTGR